MKVKPMVNAQNYTSRMLTQVGNHFLPHNQGQWPEGICLAPIFVLHDVSKNLSNTEYTASRWRPSLVGWRPSLLENNRNNYCKVEKE